MRTILLKGASAATFVIFALSAIGSIAQAQINVGATAKVPVSVNVGATASTTTSVDAGAQGSDATVLGNATVETSASTSDKAAIDAYAQGVAASDSNVSHVSATDSDVSLRYKAPGRFLGIFPVTVNAIVSADATGKASVDYPWYDFLTSVDDAGMKDSVQSNVSAVVGTGASSQSSANAAFSADTKVALIGAMHSALKGWSQAHASLSATTK